MQHQWAVQTAVPFFLRTLALAEKQFFKRKFQFCDHATSFMVSVVNVSLFYVFVQQRDILLSTQSPAVAQLVENDSDNTNVMHWFSTGFSQHSMWSGTTHQSILVWRPRHHSLGAMCFLTMDYRVWWPQWSRWWCWTALCDFPPHCWAPLWATGSRSLRLGLSWGCCLTLSWLLWCSAACCSEQWIVTA